MNALKRASQNRTSLCIAHRLSTIVDSNRIYVLKDGKVIEEGDHMSLVQNPNSFYAYLWDKQHQADRELQEKLSQISSDNESK